MIEPSSNAMVTARGIMCFFVSRRILSTADACIALPLKTAHSKQTLLANSSRNADSSYAVPKPVQLDPRIVRPMQAPSTPLTNPGNTWHSSKTTCHTRARDNIETEQSRSTHVVSTGMALAMSVVTSTIEHPSISKDSKRRKSTTCDTFRQIPSGKQPWMDRTCLFAMCRRLTRMRESASCTRRRRDGLQMYRSVAFGKLVRTISNITQCPSSLGRRGMPRLVLLLCAQLFTEPVAVGSDSSDNLRTADAAGTYDRCRGIFATSVASRGSRNRRDFSERNSEQVADKMHISSSFSHVTIRNCSAAGNMHNAERLVPTRLFITLFCFFFYSSIAYKTTINKLQQEKTII